MFALEQWIAPTQPRPTRLLLLPPVARPAVALLPAMGVAVTQDERCTACGGRHSWMSEVFGFTQDHVCPHCDRRGVMLRPLAAGQPTWEELAAIEDELWREAMDDQRARLELCYPF